jgi:hypothetical protein
MQTLYRLNIRSLLCGAVLPCGLPLPFPSPANLSLKFSLEFVGTKLGTSVTDRRHIRGDPGREFEIFYLPPPLTRPRRGKAQAFDDCRRHGWPPSARTSSVSYFLLRESSIISRGISNWGGVLAELLGLAQLGFAWVGLLCGDQIRYEGTYIVGLFRIRVLLLIIISFSTIALSWSKEPI